MTDYEKSVSKLRRKIERKKASLRDSQKELDTLLDSCPCDVVVHKSHYTPGGYDYVSETKYWDECQLCMRTVREYESKYGYYS